MKGKNIRVFLLKKLGGALIRVGALNRDYTVVMIFANSGERCLVRRSLGEWLGLVKWVSLGVIR